MLRFDNLAMDNQEKIAFLLDQLHAAEQARNAALALVEVRQKELDGAVREIKGLRAEVAELRRARRWARAWKWKAYRERAAMRQAVQAMRSLQGLPPAWGLPPIFGRRSWRRWDED